MKRICTFFLIIFMAVSIGNASAENKWIYSGGKFISNYFHFDIPSTQFNKTLRKEKEGIILSNKSDNMYLAIGLFEDTDQTLEEITSELNIQDSSFLSRVWAVSPSESLKGTFVSTTKRTQENMHMIEYKFTGTMNKKNVLSYYCILGFADTSEFCKVMFLATDTMATRGKTYYFDIIDSVMDNQPPYTPASVWTCPKCGTINSNDVCRECGKERYADSTSVQSNDKNNSSSYTESKEILPSLIGPFTGDMINVTLDNNTYSVHQEFKDVMDRYEQFFDDYIELLNHSNSSDYFMKYGEFMKSYTEVMIALEKLDNMDESDRNWTNDENLYYIQVMLRIDEKLLSALGVMQ